MTTTRRTSAITVLVVLLTLLPGTWARASGSVTAASVADTYVAAASPTRSYGGAATARADDAGKIAYVRFEVDGIPAGAPVTAATLVVRGVGSQPTRLVDVHEVGQAWSEAMTYRTRPVLGPRVGSVSVGSGVTASVPVPVEGNGPVSFAVVRTATGGDTVLGTRENRVPANRPTLVVTFGDPPPPAPPPTPFTAYSADSFFRRPLPADTPVSATSVEGVAFAWAREPFPYLKIRGVQGADPGANWGMAYGEADCDDPLYTLAPTGLVPVSQEHLRTDGFHAPPSVWQHIPPNTDAPFVVVDRCGTPTRPGGLTVWGSGASVSGQVVTVRAAGSFAHDSNGLDRRNPRSDSALNERSRGVIPDSMLIRTDLLDHAIRTGTGLGHVLEVFWVETDATAGFAHPMVGYEGGKYGYGAEGERFRIRSSVDLAARPGCTPESNPVGLAIARTLQQHGAYLGDNSGSGSGIKTEQDTTYPGLTADSLRGCMTWDDIEFLPRGWDG